MRKIFGAISLVTGMALMVSCLGVKLLATIPFGLGDESLLYLLTLSLVFLYSGLASITGMGTRTLNSVNLEAVGPRRSTVGPD